MAGHAVWQAVSWDGPTFNRQQSPQASVNQMALATGMTSGEFRPLGLFSTSEEPR